MFDISDRKTYASLTLECLSSFKVVKASSGEITHVQFRLLHITLAQFARVFGMKTEYPREPPPPNRLQCFAIMEYFDRGL